MIVMKFGGTSVGSVEAMERTIGIVRGRLAQRPVVVVSAMSKVTDMLYAYADAVAAARTAPAEQTTAPTAVEFATKASAITVQHMGAQESIPYRKDI